MVWTARISTPLPNWWTTDRESYMRGPSGWSFLNLGLLIINQKLLLDSICSGVKLKCVRCKEATLPWTWKMKNTQLIWLNLGACNASQTSFTLYDWLYCNGCRWWSCSCSADTCRSIHWPWERHAGCLYMVLHQVGLERHVSLAVLGPLEWCHWCNLHW